MFVFEIQLGSCSYDFDGFATSKREAKHIAARHALSFVRKELLKM